MKIKQCVECGGDFEPNAGSQKVCGHECRMERIRRFDRERRPGGKRLVMEIRSCKGCGTEFEAKASYGREFHDEACKNATFEARRYDGKYEACRHPGGCPEPARRDGWCFMHYQRVMTHGDPGPAERLILERDPGRKCYVCGEPAVGQGLCYGHHWRLLHMGEAGGKKVRGREMPEGHASWTPGQKHRYYKYGLTPEMFAAMLRSQGGKCANRRCINPTPNGDEGWHVDHDHACCSGKTACGYCVRGILCSRCNQALGLAYDSINVLEGLIEYRKETGQAALFRAEFAEVTA